MIIMGIEPISSAYSNPWNITCCRRPPLSQMTIRSARADKPDNELKKCLQPVVLVHDTRRFPSSATGFSGPSVIATRKSKRWSRTQRESSMSSSHQGKQKYVDTFSMRAEDLEIKAEILTRLLSIWICCIRCSSWAKKKSVAVTPNFWFSGHYGNRTHTFCI
jgi:hypothetical protein